MSYRDELIQVAAVAIAALQCDIEGGTDRGFSRDAFLKEIKQERIRQEVKWGNQTHGRLMWMTILMEEVGEAANAILEEGECTQCHLEGGL